MRYFPYIFYIKGQLLPFMESFYYFKCLVELHKVIKLSQIVLGTVLLIQLLNHVDNVVNKHL